LAGRRGEDIDYSDNPPLTAEFWKNAERGKSSSMDRFVRVSTGDWGLIENYRFFLSPLGRVAGAFLADSRVPGPWLITEPERPEVTTQLLTSRGGGRR